MFGRRRVEGERPRVSCRDAALAARGVPEGERSAALAGIDAEGERARLLEALAKRERALGGLTGRERSRKLFDHLVRRGFSPDAVLEALRRKGEAADADE